MNSICNRSRPPESEIEIGLEMTWEASEVDLEMVWARVCHYIQEWSSMESISYAN